MYLNQHKKKKMYKQNTKIINANRVPHSNKIVYDTINVVKIFFIMKDDLNIEKMMEKFVLIIS